LRIVIVGGGIVGLMTAVESVSAGHEVVLLDQGDIPYPQATSHDQHRTVRALHMKQPAAAGPAVRAHRRWIALQRQLGVRFYARVGTLTVLPPERVPPAMDMLAAAGARADVFDPDELTSRYPHVEFPIGESAIFEPDVGVLLADRVLAACVGWLRRRPGVQLRTYSRVVEVDPDRHTVRLADGETVSGDALLLAGGPWSRELLPAQVADGLTLYRQSMLYCRVPVSDAAAWSETPAMISIGADGCAWLVPPVAGTPLKLSAGSACRAVDAIEDAGTPRQWLDLLVATFSEVIPGFRADWLIGARDGYYLAHAATDGASVAVLGERTVSYCACGGSSFKFAPLIARALTEHLTGPEPRPKDLEAIEATVVRLRPAATPAP
jgi:glycine/D-amino acid oxidase-like deaminating enzyme